MMNTVELKTLIKESLQEVLNEAKESEYPQLTYQQLIDLYDYLYANGFSDELYSRHKSLINPEVLQRYDVNSKAVQTAGKINYIHGLRDFEIESQNKQNTPAAKHLYWMLTFDERGNYATLSFNYLGTNPRDMDRVKTAIKNFCVANNIDESQVLPFLELPSKAVTSKIVDTKTQELRLTIKFKVKDPKNVSPFLKKHKKEI